MKKILNALFLTLLAVLTFSSCSDVPAPYDILGEGDVPGLTGDGTKENPYNIATAQQKQDGSIAWVQGYIVGAMEDVLDDKGEFAGNKASFTAPFNITSNVLIAESPDETNESKCLPVKIKNGSDLANALNLKDHPENKGGVLLIQGELNAGFGKPALINTTAGVFNNKEIGEEQGGGDLDPNNPLELDGSVTPLTDFSNNFDDVQHQADYSKTGWINKAIKGNRIWQGAIFDPQKYLAASTYGVTKGEIAEYWFVTPHFTVDADKKLSFKATVNKYSETMSLKVFFLQLKDGKMEKSEISVSGIPTAGTYQWTTDLIIDLSTYAGQNGFVGFQYVATRGEEVQTYGIDDIVYGEGGGGEVPGPDPVGDGTKENPYDVATALSLSTTTGTTVAWVKGYIVGGVNSDNASSSVDGPEDLIFGVTGIRTAALVIAGSANETDYKKCLVLGFGNDSPDAKVALNLVDHPENLGKEVFLQGVLKYAFSAPGMKTITEYEFVSGGGTDPEPSTGELFISEYVEGSSYNKYIEIYNPTSQSIDLSSYVLKLEQDGKGIWTKEATLSGSLASKSVIVYKNSQATAYTGEAIINNDVINFNGNDPVGLFKDGELIDLFGVSSETPGQAVTDFAKDKTFKRKATVKGPSAIFNTEEWEVLGKDVVLGLGSHTME